MEQTVPAGTGNSSLTRITWIVYALQVLSFFTVVTEIAGVIINIVKQGEAKSEPLIDAHFRWQIRTFWWSLAWSLIRVALCFTVVGIVVAIPI